MHSNGTHPDQNGSRPGPVAMPGPDGPRGESQMPYSPQATAAADSAEKQQLRAILAAIRRRWFIALIAGALLGGAAGAGAWYLVPTPYTAFGDLKVFVSKTGQPWESAKVLDATFKPSMIQRVREPFVVNRALRTPEVAGCRTLASKEFKDLWLQQNLDVRAVGPDNIRISLSGEHPADLALIVNAVIKAFEVEVIDQYQIDQQQRLTVLKEVRDKESNHRAELKAQLRRINQQIESGTAAQNDLRVQQQNSVMALLRGELGQIQMKILQSRAQLAALGGDSAADMISQVEIPEALLDEELAKNPEYALLYNQVTQQQNRVAQYVKRAKPDQTLRVAAEQKLKELEDRLSAARAEQAPLVRGRLLAMIAPSSSSADSLRKEIETLRVFEAQYLADLDQNKKESRSIHLLILEQLDLQTEFNDSDVRVKNYDKDIYNRTLEIEKGRPPIAKYLDAEIPRIPDQGKRMKLAGISGGGIFALVAAVIFWLEMMTRRISSAQDVESNLGLRIVGSVPLMPRSVATGRLRGKSGKTAYWQSVLTESIDSARTMLLKLSKTDGVKTVMIASSTGSEGKTTLACHLATSLARGGRRVLLMDCDIRRPSVHEVFDLPNGQGFCETLCGKATLEESILASSHPGLFVLRAGRIDHETLQRLALDHFGAMLREISQDYDFVIIDSAPLLPVTDSLMLAQHVDGVMFSVKRDVSRLTKVSAAIQRLALLGAPIIGVVTIGLDPNTQAYSYANYYSSYGYGYRRLPTAENVPGSV